MTVFTSYGDDIFSVFQLMGYKENDISKSTAWMFKECPELLKIFIEKIFGNVKFDINDVFIKIQEHEKNLGYTDIEIGDNNNFHIVIEAKRGWVLPRMDQLIKYSLREPFINPIIKNKLIVTMSECSSVYAEYYQEISTANNIRITHISWKDIYHYADEAYKLSSNSQKRLLSEFQTYLGGLMTMQNITSNEVYVVSLGSGKPDNCSISWIDIVKSNKKYFHPIGENGWPKKPPNYIAFRYWGKLQSIHHIEGYSVTKNLSNEVVEMPNKLETVPFFVYTLGEAIIPLKEVKTGKIYASGRVRCHLDTLFTSLTIAEARDITINRTRNQ